MDSNQLCVVGQWLECVCVCVWRNLPDVGEVSSIRIFMGEVSRELMSEGGHRLYSYNRFEFRVFFFS